MSATQRTKKSGCLGRLFKFILLLLGLGVIAGFADHLITEHTLKGSWQYVHTEWSETTVDLLIASAEQKMSSGSQQGSAGRPDAESRKAVTKLSNSLMSAFTSGLVLNLSDGGYRLDGSSGGGRVITRLFRILASGKDKMGGCTTGTYLAIFPFIRADCGDGTGRSLWFMIRGWPGDTLSLFLLPLGNTQLHESIEKASGGARTKEQTKAAKELLLFQFKRTSP
jgi:hypothetical protein